MFSIETMKLMQKIMNLDMKRDKLKYKVDELYEKIDVLEERKQRAEGKIADINAEIEAAENELAEIDRKKGA